ncbi:MAG: lipoate--protein ligase family protein [Candidatus Izimaplasma sp.]|nr:lipoate--protein ligase family protein [Candidatus Izimaplasma bacterium]
MAVLFSESNDIHYNLAIEEYLLRNYELKEDILFIWYGAKAFVFGRNQNPFIEIHPKYLKDDSIPKIRRISGGGTIYQDQGTINFSYLTNNFKNKINNYQYFLSPIIDLLKSHGLNANFVPKSHLFIDNNKISGNAQAFINNRLLHHGTILYDTNLNIIEEALINHNQKADGHHILSNKTPVTNLKKLIKLDKKEFVRTLINKICDDKNINSILLTLEDNEKIKQLEEEKYLSWDWNFGKTPSFDFSMKFKEETIKFKIEKGTIKSVSNDKYNYLLGVKFFSKKYFDLINS